jgi:hypothetical protein
MFASLRAGLSRDPRSIRSHLWQPYFDQFPLTDRITHYYELLAALFIGVFLGAGLSLVSIIARRIGMSSTGMTVMLSMPFVGNLFSLYFGHHVQKRRNKMAFVFWPGITGRLVVALVVFARTPGTFLVVMSVYYLLSTIPGPAYASIMRTNYSDANRSRLMSTNRVVRTIVSALAAYGAGALLDLHPDAYRWIIPASALIGMIGSLLFRRIRVRREQSTQAPPVSFRSALRVIRGDRPFLIFMLLFFICSGPPKMAIPLEPILFVDELHFDYRDAGLILGTISPVMSVAGFVLWAVLLRRFGALTLSSVMFLMSTVRYVVLALATDPVHTIPASALSGLANAGFELLPLFVMIRFAGANLPLYIAFHSTLVGLRGILGPFIGNFLYANLGMRIVDVFWIITGISGAGVIGMFIFAFVQQRAWKADDGAAAGALSSITGRPCRSSAVPAIPPTPRGRLRSRSRR